MMLSVTAQGVSNNVFCASTDVSGTAVLAENGEVIFGDVYGDLYGLGANGERRWWGRVGEIFFASPTLTTNGNIIIADNYNQLFAFKYGTPPAQTTWPMFRHDLRHTGKAGAH
jgi:hypothetical protein